MNGHTAVAIGMSPDFCTCGGIETENDIHFAAVAHGVKSTACHRHRGDCCARPPFSKLLRPFFPPIGRRNRFIRIFRHADGKRNRYGYRGGPIGRRQLRIETLLTERNTEVWARKTPSTLAWMGAGRSPL
jgi:hypothetical protein